MKLFIFLFFSSSILFSAPTNSRFYSPNAVQALLKFSFTAELNKNSQPTQTEFQTAIEKQLTFLFGGFSSQERKAVPKIEHQFQILKIYQVNTTTWRVDYSYSGLILIPQGPSSYSFYLPINPFQVWNRSRTNNPKNPYPCTDPTHAIENYFWYFFNPKAYDCPLVENQDYYRVQGQLQSYPNTQETFPEYDRLFSNGELTFHILFGMDDSTKDWNPLTSRDINAESYRQLKQVLTRWKYQSQIWSNAEVDKFFGNTSLYGKKPFVEELVKTTPKGLVRYRIFFGASTLWEGLGFQKFLAYSLMNSSVMIYAGHSGLGEYLNLDLMQNTSQIKLQANQDRYQIYFFNSCSSYPYYNSQYFNLKKTAADPKGTKNLDIVTNGLSTLFLSIAPSSYSVMEAIELYSLKGVKTSYQKMMDQANSNNLIGINGDEDNQR